MRVVEAAALLWAWQRFGPHTLWACVIFWASFGVAGCIPERDNEWDQLRCDPACTGGLVCKAGACVSAPASDQSVDQAPGDLSSDSSNDGSEKDQALPDAAPPDILAADKGAGDLTDMAQGDLDSSAGPDMPATDVGTTDTQSGPGDASADTGKCKTNKDCDDNLTCTLDICSVSGCTNVVNGPNCLINKTCYSSGTFNTSANCQKCIPSGSTTAWTLLSGYCFIGSKCLSTGAPAAGNNCKQCTPTKDPYNWTDLAGGTCDDGKACTHSDTCVSGACVGTSYVCDDKLSCTSDQCLGTGPAPGGCKYTTLSSYCLIKGACQSSGKVNQASSCQTCEPAKSQSTWSKQPCVSNYAGDGTSGYADGPAASAWFKYLNSLALDKAEDLYVLDSCMVRKISGGQVSTFLGGSTCGLVNGPQATAQLTNAWGITFGTKDELYFSSRVSPGYVIRQLVNGQVSRLAGSGSYGYGDGTYLSAQFDQPRGLTVDSSGTIYVPDSGGIRVLSGGNVSTMPGYTDSAFDVALDGSGKVFFVDSSKNRIMVAVSGNVTQYAGDTKAGLVDGALNTAKFNFPMGLFFDSKGRLYVADNGNSAIRVIQGGQVTTLAGNGNQGYVNGPGINARFNSPMDVVVDSKFNVYVSDSMNNRIRRITQ